MRKSLLLLMAYLFSFNPVALEASSAGVSINGVSQSVTDWQTPDAGTIFTGPIDLTAGLHVATGEIGVACNPFSGSNIGDHCLDCGFLRVSYTLSRSLDLTESGSSVEVNYGVWARVTGSSGEIFSCAGWTFDPYDIAVPPIYGSRFIVSTDGGPSSLSPQHNARVSAWDNADTSRFIWVSATASAHSDASPTGFTIFLFGFHSLTVSFNGVPGDCAISGVGNAGFQAHGQITAVPGAEVGSGILQAQGGPIVVHLPSNVAQGMLETTSNRPIGMSFSAVNDGDWADMGFPYSGIRGYHFHAADTSLFTAITNFPAYVTNDFTILVSGTNFGTFRAGQTCSFPGGIQDFELQWQGPVMATNGSLAKLAFPLTLVGTSNAAFDVTFLGPSGPMPVLPPANFALLQGTNATLSAFALGADQMTYQWLHNSNIISSATNNIFQINNAQPSDAGDYRVIVTDSTGCATNTVATVLVATGSLIPPVLIPGAAGIASNGLTFTFEAQLEPAKFYRVQTSIDLVNWATATNFLSSSTRFKFADAAVQPGRYYRIVSP